MIALADRIIDSDGLRVIVSEGELRVKNRLYKMEQVKGYGMGIQKPERLPGLVMSAGGFALVIFISGGFLFWLGALCFVIGILWALLAKRKYLMRISTPLGDQDILVSEKKEDISRIMHAIDEMKWQKITRELEKK